VIALIVILVIIVVIALALVASYNRFVSQRNAVQNAWSDIDTELKRRYDLIPKPGVDGAGIRAHERGGVFEEVAQARSVGLQAQGPAAASAAEGPFQMALGHLFAVAEAYPDLKAQSELPAAPGDPLRHRESHPGRPPDLQLQRAVVQHSCPGVPVERRGQPVSTSSRPSSSRSTPRSAPSSPRRRRSTSAPSPTRPTARRPERRPRPGPRRAPPVSGA